MEGSAVTTFVFQVDVWKTQRILSRAHTLGNLTHK